MLQYRATSTRITDGHGANLFTNSHDHAVSWAAVEAKAGHPSRVFQVIEVMTDTVEKREMSDGSVIAIITVISVPTVPVETK